MQPEAHCNGPFIGGSSGSRPGMEGVNTQS